MSLLVESQNIFKGKYDELENELQEKEKDIEDRIMAHSA